MTQHGNRFRLRDAAEMAVGSWMLTIPLTVTEEVRDLGKELSGGRAVSMKRAVLVARPGSFVATVIDGLRK